MITAKIITLRNKNIELFAKNMKNLMVKLQKNKVYITEIDLTFLSLKKGYSWTETKIINNRVWEAVQINVEIN